MRNNKNIYWQTKKLGEICHISIGKTPARGNKKFWDVKKETNNIWLSIRDLNNTLGKEIFESREYISDSGACLFKPVKKGTLLVSFKLTLGRLAFAGVDLYTNEAIAALEIKNDKALDKQYLHYYLTFFDWVAETKGDTKVKGKTLNKAKLKEISIFLPPLSEQKRLVSLLDDIFEKLEKAKENTGKNLKNAKDVFESYLSGVFAEKGEAWEEKQLAEIANVKHGFAFKSQHFVDNGTYLLLTPGNFFEAGGYRDRGKKQKYYNGPIPNGFILMRGDLLIAMTEQAAGLLGSPVIVPESDKFLHNQRLGLLSWNPREILDVKFLFYFFNTKIVREEIHATATGVKVRHTSPQKILDLRISFPSLSTQKSIVTRIDALSAETKKLGSIYQQKLAAIEELKKYILQQAFSGKLI